jgi:hypothetical protein
MISEFIIQHWKRFLQGFKLFLQELFNQSLFVGAIDSQNCETIT